MKITHLKQLSLTLALSLLSGYGLAGIQVSGTRIVFPASDREASVQVSNEGVDDVMIQSWVEAASGKLDSQVPFAITPSLARLSYKKRQILRIFYQGKGLPQDRESVVWLNIQEIPQVASNDNSLQVAFRQRLKIFYRPSALTGTAEKAAEQLKWKFINSNGTSLLLAANHSAFHVSFAQVQIISGQKKYTVEPVMVSPSSTQLMKVKGNPDTLNEQAEVLWESIDDYGAVIKHKAPLSRRA